MAAANIAECFYARGLNVIILDWDLEALGIESFFAPSLRLGERERVPDGAASDGGAGASLLGGSGIPLHWPGNASLRQRGHAR